MRTGIVCCAVCLAFAFPGVAGEMSGDDVWAGRVRHPAVVNPAVPADDGSVVSLRGEWEFASSPNCRGAHEIGWQEEIDFHGRPGVFSNARKIQVPGCWDAQGVGEPGEGLSYNCKSSGMMLKTRHLGNGFYRKTVTLPASWRGKRIWLKIGRVNTLGYAWIDGEAVAQMSDSYRAGKWDVTDLVTPGKPFRLLIEVNNSYQYRNAQLLTCHRWGGLVRDVEFEATPADCFIDDAWVRGDFDGRKAVVMVEVQKGEKKVGQESRSTKDGSLVLRMTVEGEKTEIPLSNSNSSLQHELPLPNFRPWSPEHPNLYTAKVELVSADGKIVQRRYERFGVRKLEVRGEEFYLNNRPFLVRGYGDDSTYPITGFSPASKDYHLNHLRIARMAGFNYVRTHTHVELPEYFQAADEAGILIQAELHYGGDHYIEECISYEPLRDAQAVTEACRRYASYATLSGGNEGTHGPYAGKALYRWVKENDPGRLVIEQDGGTYINGNLAETSDFASGPMYMWERGTFNPRAFVCHEYANLAIKGDARMEDDYTGVWAPRFTRAERRANLAPAGLGDEWGDRLQDAQGDLQRFWGKRSVECARKDPFCDGYIYWTIVDFTHPHENAGIREINCQGLFDPFWRPRPHGATPESFAVANGPTAILLDTENRTRTFGHIDYVSPAGKNFRAMRTDYPSHLCCDPTSCLSIDETNRVYVSGEKIPAEFILSHYGEDDLTDAKLVWQLDLGVRQGCRTNVDEASLPRQEIALGSCKAGPAKTVAKDFITVPDVSKPVKATLTATVVAKGSVRARNDWSFWFFPKATAPAVPENVVVADFTSAAVDRARAAGKNILIVGHRKGERDIFLGWWALDWRTPHCKDWSQNGVAAVPHPVFGDFPFEPFLSPLLFNIIGQGTVLPVDGFSEKDFIMVGEGITDFKLYLAAKTRPDGGREVFVSGLDLWSDRPESVSLRTNILRWLSTSSK